MKRTDADRPLHRTVVVALCCSALAVGPAPLRAGDLNADFIRPLDRKLRLMERFLEVELQLVPVADGVSFRGKRGPGTRIDHVFVGGSLRGVSGAYSWEAIDREHPGCRGCSHGVPDHALLSVEVSS